MYFSAFAAIGRIAAQAAGALLILAAGALWFSFDYPALKAFELGAPLAPGMVGQVLIWILAAAVGACGWFFCASAGPSRTSGSTRGSRGRFRHSI